MLRALGLSVLNGLLFIVAGIIHRILIRNFGLPLNNALIYWGAFLGIFFLLSFIALLIVNVNLKRS